MQLATNLTKLVPGSIILSHESRHHANGPLRWNPAKPGIQNVMQDQLQSARLQLQPGISGFLKFAAVCSVLSALTTTLLIAIETPAAGELLIEAQLSKNPTYLFKRWIFFFHPQLYLVAMLALLLTLLKRSPGFASIGFVFMFIWAVTEALQQALTIDALNQYWRPQLLASTAAGNSGDPRANSALILIEGFPAIYDSYYFLLLFAFGVGSLSFGWLMLSIAGLARWLGLAMVFFGVLSLVSFGMYYGGWSAVSGFVNFSYQWLYPVLQPAARLLLGFWLWRLSTASP